jgi:protease I
MTTNKRILMIIAFDGFRDEEYLEPKKVLEQAGFKIVTASTQLGLAQGKLGAKTKADIILADVKPADYDAIVFIGGPGSHKLIDDPLAHKIAQEAAKLGKVLGGICAAAAILAEAGLLKNLKATSFSGVSDRLIKNGAHYTAGGLEVAGKIITADGPAHATAFGQAIVNALR